MISAESVIMFMGAAVMVSAGLAACAALIFVSALALVCSVKYLYNRALIDTYKVETVRYYLQLMENSGRKGLRKELGKDKSEDIE